MEKPADNTFRNRAGRALGDLVMAELFLVQATIESANAIGEGITELRENMYWEESDSQQQLSAFLQRTRERVVEPYSTRFRYLRDMVRDDIAA